MTIKHMSAILFCLVATISYSAIAQTFRPNSIESQMVTALASRGILIGGSTKDTWPKEFPLKLVRDLGKVEVYRASCQYGSGADKTIMYAKCMYPAFDKSSGKLEYIELAAGTNLKVQWSSDGSFTPIGPQLNTPQAIYIVHCGLCHTTGMANAPRLNDKGAWVGRLAKGRDTFIQSAASGIGAMPPTPLSVSNEEIGAVVDYMISIVR
jgi:cytochrome c5